MPTQEYIDQMFMEQEARNIQKFLARRAGAPIPDFRDAAVELAAAGEVPRDGWITPVVDVNRTPLRPVANEPPPPYTKTEAHCKFCGRVFKAKTLAAAKMSTGRHEKKAHAGESAVV